MNAGQRTTERETIFATEFGEKYVDQLGMAGNRLIEAQGMHEPITCTLFDDCGAKLRTWVLGDSTADQNYAGSIQEVWSRSNRGVTLTIQDRDGKSAEVLLIVGSVQ